MFGYRFLATASLETASRHLTLPLMTDHLELSTSRWIRRVPWLSILSLLLTIAIAIWSKRIIPSVLVVLLVGGYLLDHRVTGGFQRYAFKDMIGAFISGANEIMRTLMILAIAWPLAAVAQKLGLNIFIQQLVGNALPVWSAAIALFVLSATVTYFIGSDWGGRIPHHALRSSARGDTRRWRSSVRRRRHHRGSRTRRTTGGAESTAV